MSSCTGVSENNSQSSQKFQVTYGDALKGFRILNNLSRQELAKKIMCTSAYIGALESNIMILCGNGGKVYESEGTFKRKTI